MKITFLGTGTSQGVPVIGCDCAVCTSTNPKNRRNRTHIHVEIAGLNLQVDAAQEFRLQALKHRIPKIDAILLTHGHADHILGMDDMRRYCDLKGGEAIDIYTTQEGEERMRSIFDYAIRDKPKVNGYPAFRVQQMPKLLELDGVRIHSTIQNHGHFETLGLVFEELETGKRFAYYTDCSSVSEEAEGLARAADVVVLDGLRHKPHFSHMNIDGAIQAAQRIAGKETYLIHMTHEIDHEETEASLPQGIFLSYDDLILQT